MGAEGAAAGGDAGEDFGEVDAHGLRVHRFDSDERDHYETSEQVREARVPRLSSVLDGREASTRGRWHTRGVQGNAVGVGR